MKFMKFLIVIDMQNDFIDGALANPAAQAIVDKIANYITSWDGEIIFTRDTHYSDYLDTYEGKKLPIPHCIIGTNGWRINEKILDAACEVKEYIDYVDKPTFGYVKGLKEHIDSYDGYVTSIEVVGTCTDICVISNVLGLKEAYPQADIIVHKDMCAGSTKEKHEAAIEVMRSCQVQIV